MAELWTKWEGQVVNGVFPLRRLLGGSDHSGVFLTEYAAPDLANAAIKLLRADPTLTGPTLLRWKMAATLSHPHLVRVLDSGRCQLEGADFLFVVMEYADQNLSEILPRRPLTADEVAELLAPTLKALSFLHGENLVQGRLRPSNILVVNDQLKLASDTVHPAGEFAAGLAGTSEYDPPEAANRRNSTAADVWALGASMVEALTQHVPAGPVEQWERASLPADLPQSLADTIRRCLSIDPEKRPTVAELQNPTPAIPAARVASPVPSARSATPPSPSRRSILPLTAVLLVVVAAVWGGYRLLRTDSTQGASDSAEPRTVPPPPKAAEAFASSTLHSAERIRPANALHPPSQSNQSGANGSSPVVHEEIPQVPRSARSTIHGHVKVTVRVTVDRSGNVVDQNLENPGSSKYFARLASAAARKWKFAAAQDQRAREWLLRFDFTRGGVTGHATAPGS
jgi:TonB family protein